MTVKRNNREIGTNAEQKVKQYLQSHGIDVLEMNYRCRQGEIDVIAKDQEYYVFIEVKYRNSAQYGYPMEAVDARKQRRISKTAAYYLYSHGLSEYTPVRFDVASLTQSTITYYKNAFEFVV